MSVPSQRARSSLYHFRFCSSSVGPHHGPLFPLICRYLASSQKHFQVEQKGLPCFPTPWTRIGIPQPSRHPLLLTCAHRRPWVTSAPHSPLLSGLCLWVLELVTAHLRLLQAQEGRGRTRTSAEHR